MFLPVLPIVIAFAGQTAAPPPPVPRPAQVVRPAATPAPVYNETADAKAAIAKAIAAADADDIRVLINWGANDCKLCTAFTQTWRSPELAPARYSNEYKVVHVDVGRLDKNLDLAKTYGAKLSADTLPALTVLDEHGKVLAQATAADLVASPGAAAYDTKRVGAFLSQHQAPAPDAIADFNKALGQAKNSGKTLFVWFSAPW